MNVGALTWSGCHRLFSVTLSVLLISLARLKEFGVQKLCAGQPSTATVAVLPGDPAHMGLNQNTMWPLWLPVSLPRTSKHSALQGEQRGQYSLTVSPLSTAYHHYHFGVQSVRQKYIEEDMFTCIIGKTVGETTLGEAGCSEAHHVLSLAPTPAQLGAPQWLSWLPLSISSKQIISTWHGEMLHQDHVNSGNPRGRGASCSLLSAWQSLSLPNIVTCSLFWDDIGQWANVMVFQAESLS